MRQNALKYPEMRGKRITNGLQIPQFGQLVRGNFCVNDKTVLAAFPARFPTARNAWKPRYGLWILAAGRYRVTSGKLF